MKRWKKRLYNFNSVQLTFNQCVFNRIQYRTEHNLYSTRLDNSTDKSTDGLIIPLTTPPYNTAYNSYLQFRLTNSYLQIRLTIGLTILVDQNGWNDPSSDSTVVQSGCLVPRPSLADVSRIGHSNGRGNPWQGQFWWHFSVDRFPIMDLSPGPTLATLTTIAETGPFIRFLSRFTAVYSYTCAYACIYAQCISIAE